MTVETQTQGQSVTAALVAPAIQLIGVSKSFGPVQANKDIDMTVAKGAIHGIVGENGAGKSTLMSILYGFYKADAGEIKIDGVTTEITDSHAAIAAGIGMVHQHFMLVKPFTVLENVIMGAEDGPLLRPSLNKARKVLAELAAEYELDVDPDAIVGDLSVGFQQRVEILKALYREADILILDEPTGVLTPAEADHLFRILENLKSQGKTIVLITHKLREIMAVTDTVSVMRRGKMTATVKTSETSASELADLMVGRHVVLEVDKSDAEPGEIILEVKNLCVTDFQGVKKLKDVSLKLKAGEILGVAGVAGNGQSDLLNILGGIEAADSGEVIMNGVSIDLSKKASAAMRRERGIGHVPEDRHALGLVMPFQTWENAVFGYHNNPEFSKKFGLADQKAMMEDTKRKIEKYDIRPTNPHLLASNYSGGNQQKIVIAREIENNPEVLLVGQPTRGVDIGAIEFIHKQIVALRDEGKAVLLVSVELEEILALSDRIIVMFDGVIQGERMPKETNEQELGMLMAGIDPEAST